LAKGGRLDATFVKRKKKNRTDLKNERRKGVCEGQGGGGLGFSCAKRTRKKMIKKGDKTRKSQKYRGAVGGEEAKKKEDRNEKKALILKVSSNEEQGHRLMKSLCKRKNNPRG